MFLEGVMHGLAKRLDDAQLECVTTHAAASLFVVAGPGSGKTTAITLRVLRLIFVDLFDPAAILATTFTNRAADELRSRILGWGTTGMDESSTSASRAKHSGASNAASLPCMGSSSRCSADQDEDLIRLGGVMSPTCCLRARDRARARRAGRPPGLRRA